VNRKTKQNARRLDELMSPMMLLMHRFNIRMSRCEELTIAQHRVLMMVHHAGTMTVKQFQESLLTAQSTASEMVERMVRQGWLKKCKNPEDGRITVFALTGKADRLLKEKEAKRILILEKILEPLSSGEQARFMESFEMILDKHEARKKDPAVKGQREKDE
jgi:MarR family transcriptional regulator, organic hydroperoxide resistance regulator